MIIHYGYKDGSGEYYVTIDAGKCTGCGECVALCPGQALEMTDIMIGLDEKKAAAVKEEHRRQLRYTCAACDHAGVAPCQTACRPRAVAVTWRPAPAPPADE